MYPPEDYKGRADIGFCKSYKEPTNENDCCCKGYEPDDTDECE
jgi:hypothetical protein